MRHVVICYTLLIDKVPAILECLMPGQEDGNALASLLFGDVSPSGKLPLSFPVSDDETWLGTNASQYPGIDDVEYYSEERLIGYHFCFVLFKFVSAIVGTTQTSSTHCSLLGMAFLIPHSRIAICSFRLWRFLSI